MKGNRRIGTAAPLALSIIAASFAFASLAGATPAPRTFVASTGNDSNTVANCPIATPCRSFLAAYGVTASGGEIIALDTAGFGCNLTITMPISIIGTPQGAETTVAGGQTCITVNPGSGGTVILRNLNINGQNAGTNTGVLVSSGRLSLENSVVKFLTTGLQVNSAKADIVNSIIEANTTAASTTGAGVDPNNPNTGGTTEIRFGNGSAVIGNQTGFFMSSPGTGTGGNKITILVENINASAANAFNTNIVGNTTLITGSGTECTSACNAYLGYQVDSSFNQN